MEFHQPFQISLLAGAAVWILAAGVGAEEEKAIEEVRLPPLRLYLQRHPPRLSWHLGWEHLVAQKAHREQGSMELLTEAGWRALLKWHSLQPIRGPDGPDGTIRGLQGTLEFQGGLRGEMRIEWGNEGEPRIELAGPPGTVAVRDSLLRYPGEHLLGVEGIRWDEPDASFNPEEDFYQIHRGDRFYLSSRGYGLLVERESGSQQDPKSWPRRVGPNRGELKIHAPDPDTLRIEAGGRRLVYRILPGPEPRQILERRSRLGRAVPDLNLELELPRNSEGLRSAARRALALSVLGVESKSFRLRLPEGPAGAEAGSRILPYHLISLQVASLLDVPVRPGEGLDPPPPFKAALSESRRIRREIVEPLRVRSTEDRLPPIRPLFLREPREAGIWKIADQWLLGDLILVAPVFQEEAPKRRIRFPAGKWVYFLSGQEGGPEFQGPRWEEVDVPQGKIPVFLQAQPEARPPRR